MNDPARITPQAPSTTAADTVGFLRETVARIAFIRAFESKALALSRTDPPTILGSLHLCAGQEVVPLAALAALDPEDRVVCTYRGHGWAIASGLDPAAVFAEMCHRATGLNGGRAGSAFMMAPHTRFIGENSIVGAGTTIACGIGLAQVAAGAGRVVVVAVGDGAMNQGSVHEAMAFAAIRKLPVIFVCENNGWSELTATRDMFPVERLARRAVAYGMPGETVSGTDPVAVRDAVARAAARARAGEGPSLLECRVPRLWGHYNRDLEAYRSPADKREAEAQDPLVTLGAHLLETGAVDAATLDALQAAQVAAVERIANEALAAPHPDVATVLQHVVAPPQPREARVTGRREMTYLQAVNAALHDELASNAAVVVYGEDVGKAGGIFGASKGLQKAFGAQRVFDAPIAENAILGSAVGAALAGLVPIVEIMWADFVFVALDQLVNQAANVRYLTSGRTSLPLVVRMQQGITPGSCAQHSQSIEAMLAHVPGLKVALAATPQDAYSLLRAAAADPDPCVVIEARGLYATTDTVALTDGAETTGKARVKRRGEDAVVVTWGTMVSPALAAARTLEAEGLDVGVVDLRWLNPVDTDTIDDAVALANGRVLVVHEAVRTGGFGAEVGLSIHERLGSSLPLKVRRLATPDIRIPASPVLQAAVVPNPTRIADAVRALIR